MILHTANMSKSSKFLVYRLFEARLGGRGSVDGSGENARQWNGVFCVLTR